MQGRTAQAQRTDEPNILIWTDFFLQYTMNNHFRFLFHTNYKHLANNGKWDQYMIRPTLVYTMNDHIYFQGGIQLLYTDEGELNIIEIRPWQGMNVFFPRIRNIYINHFLRIEERFFYQNLGERKASSLRGRYAITTFVPLNHRSMSPQTIYLWPNMEFLGDLLGENVERFVSTIRYSMGVGYQFNDHLRFETLYMLDRSRDSQEENFVNSDHILRFVLRYQVTKQNHHPIGL
jgi:long-subunit fatty acid transport protein